MIYCISQSNCFPSLEQHTPSSQSKAWHGRNRMFKYPLINWPPMTTTLCCELFSIAFCADARKLHLWKASDPSSGLGFGQPAGPDCWGGQQDQSLSDGWAFLAPVSPGEMCKGLSGGFCSIPLHAEDKIVSVYLTWCNACRASSCHGMLQL